MALVDDDLVKLVRLHVLESAGQTGQVPDAAEVANGLGRPRADVVEAFRELGESHVYVLEPGDPTRLRMANPYSAVPTSFGVEVGAAISQTASGTRWGSFHCWAETGAFSPPAPIAMSRWSSRWRRAV